MFDLVNHNLIVMSLKNLGEGSKMANGTRISMLNCNILVAIWKETSSRWSPEIGVGQGRRFSQILFNIGCILLSFWKKSGR